MSIAKRILETIQKFEINDIEGALIPVCIAVDATAKREYPSLKSNSVRYKAFLRDNLWIIGLVGFNGLIGQKIRLQFNHPDIKQDESGLCNIEDIIYHIIRCGLLHEASIDKYIKFSSKTILSFDRTKYIISKSLPLGLAAAVILSPFNRNEKIGDSIGIEIGKAGFLIDHIWGKKNDIGLLFKKGKL